MPSTFLFRFFVATNQNLNLFFFIGSHGSKNYCKEEKHQNGEGRVIKFVERINIVEEQSLIYKT